MKFINWFRGSVEDEKGTASFRRIDNYWLMILASFAVLYPELTKNLSTTHVYMVVILLVAGFLNTSVITADNVLRFFNRDKDTPAPQPQQPVQTHVEGDLNLTPNPNPPQQ
jgi:hypothetical protein